MWLATVLTVFVIKNMIFDFVNKYPLVTTVPARRMECVVQAHLVSNIAELAR